jgi:hypothetical protein
MRRIASFLAVTLVASVTVSAGFQGIAWAQPGNDDFPGTTISEASGCSVGTNVDATSETDEPSVIPVPVDTTSVWYSWTAPSDGSVTFRTYLRSLSDSTLAAYTGSAVNALTPVVDGNDDFYGFASQITFDASNGTTYDIRVAGYAGQTGTFALDWGGGCPAPGNDDFASATSITGASGSSTNQTNEAATLESGELDTHGVCTDNNCGTSSDLGGTSVWYAWTAPSDIDNLDVCVTHTADGSNLGPVLGEYTGSLGSLAEVAYANDSNSICDAILTFNASNGTTYMIGVGAFNGSTGGFDLSWGDRRPPVIQTLSLTVHGPKVIATFSATDLNLMSLECKIDNGSYSACTSGATFQVAFGQHTFFLRATDTAGNQTIESQSFTIKSKKIKP